MENQNRYKIKNRSEEVIYKRLNELKARFDSLKAKYLELLNDYKANNDTFKTKEDEEQFYAVWNKRNEIIEEKEALENQLREEKERSEEFEKFVDELSQGAGPGGISLPGIPQNELLYRTSGAGLYTSKIEEKKQWDPENIEKRLRHMLAQYWDLKNKEDAIEVIKANEEEIRKIGEALTRLDNEMSELVKNEKTPMSIRLLYRNERFPGRKIIDPALPQRSEEILLEKQVSQCKALIKPISKTSQKSLKVQAEKLLKDALKELQISLMQLKDTLVVTHI